MTYSFIIFSLILIFLATKSFSFLKNYVAAVRTGYPVILTPVLSQSILWHIIGPSSNRHFKRWLPHWVFERIDIVTWGWEFRLKSTMHEKLGKVFCVVSPDECSIWVAAPDLANKILQRRKDFLQPPITEKIVGFLGSNVVLANGECWQRQRRIIVPSFNETTSKLTWHEGCRQAQIMLNYLIQNPGSKTVDGLRRIAINLLGHVGYGLTRDWNPDPDRLINCLHKEDSNYLDAISLIAIFILESAFLPSWLMKLPFMPMYLQNLGNAMESAPRYTKELLERERRVIKDDSTPRNFLSTLLRASDQADLSLTDDEISGNLFIFTAAGFDTSANTMGYAVTLLAVYPEWQDWIREELIALDQDVSTWNYKETYPRCQRVLAVMFETLRLFTPGFHSIRSISESQQISDIDGIHQLTAPMMVYVSSYSIHCDKNIWGQDVMEFKPSRWIDANGQLITPPKGTFLPWSDGARICPGMKMSQVEFVAVFATLFRSSGCAPLLAGEQRNEQEREKLKRLMEDPNPAFVLRLRNPEQVELKWTKVN